MFNRARVGSCCFAFALTFVIGLAGCGKSGTTVLPPSAPQSAPVGGASSGQTRDAAQAQRRFPKVIEFDNYTMRVPSTYASQEIKKDLGPSVKLFAFRGEASAGEQPDVLTVAINTDEKTLAAARKDMRQQLVDYSAGMCNSMNVNVARRDASETGAINGLEFTRYKWFGRPKANAKIAVGPKNDPIVYGMTYGFIDGSKVMLINLACFDPDAKEHIDWAATMVATMEKK